MGQVDTEVTTQLTCSSWIVKRARIHKIELPTDYREVTKIVASRLVILYFVYIKMKVSDPLLFIIFFLLNLDTICSYSMDAEDINNCERSALLFIV